MLELPVSVLAPVRVSADTPDGILFPHKTSDPVMLAFTLEGSSHLLRLGGDNSFHFYPIAPGYPARGTLISDIEFRVDLSSRYDALNSPGPEGTLVVNDGRLFVRAIRSGDPFKDPEDLPLWLTFNAWGQPEKVGFSTWSIVARDGDKRPVLWSSGKK